MPRIFDNIETGLLPALRETLALSERSDFCGYFNLRGWKAVDDLIEAWPGGRGKQCRLLVGMQRLPQDELRAALSVMHHDDQLDNQTALRLKQKLAQEFAAQLTIGVPNNTDEAGLQRLARHKGGNSVTESQFEILKVAQCAPETPALPRQDNHHDIVRKTVELISDEEKSVGVSWPPIRRAVPHLRAPEALRGQC